LPAAWGIRRWEIPQEPIRERWSGLSIVRPAQGRSASRLRPTLCHAGAAVAASRLPRQLASGCHASVRHQQRNRRVAAPCSVCRAGHPRRSLSGRGPPRAHGVPFSATVTHFCGRCACRDDNSSAASKQMIRMRAANSKPKVGALCGSPGVGGLASSALEAGARCPLGPRL